MREPKIPDPKSWYFLEAIWFFQDFPRKGGRCFLVSWGVIFLRKDEDTNIFEMKQTTLMHSCIFLINPSGRKTAI